MNKIRKGIDTDFKLSILRVTFLQLCDTISLLTENDTMWISDNHKNVTVTSLCCVAVIAGSIGLMAETVIDSRKQSQTIRRVTCWSGRKWSLNFSCCIIYLSLIYHHKVFIYITVTKAWFRIPFRLHRYTILNAIASFSK